MGSEMCIRDRRDHKRRHHIVCRCLSILALSHGSSSGLKKIHTCNSCSSSPERVNSLRTDLRSSMQSWDHSWCLPHRLHRRRHRDRHYLWRLRHPPLLRTQYQRRRPPLQCALLQDVRHRPPVTTTSMRRHPLFLSSFPRTQACISFSPSGTRRSSGALRIKARVESY